jgi:hypothetical protein
MRTSFAIFVLALLAIAFEVYSDVSADERKRFVMLFALRQQR